MRSYAVIGFGANNSGSNPRTLTGLTDITSAGAALDGLVTDGSTEDGYEAIQYSVDNLSFTGGARSTSSS